MMVRATAWFKRHGITDPRVDPAANLAQLTSDMGISSVYTDFSMPQLQSILSARGTGISHHSHEYFPTYPDLQDFIAGHQHSANTWWRVCY